MVGQTTMTGCQLAFMILAYLTTAASSSSSIQDLVPPKYCLTRMDVVTSDGYILGLYRLGQGPLASINRPQLKKDSSRKLLAPLTTSWLKTGSAGLTTHEQQQDHSSSKRSKPTAARTEGSSMTTSPAECSSNPSLQRPVVLLQHGLLDSCAGFLLAGPGSGLAFILVDAGFDVWLANSRGSTQSRGHAWLDSETAAYWSFSWDQMAQYDLPATIDAVLSVTGAARLAFVSHSQGGTLLLAALATQPKLADVLGLAILMAPVAIARHAGSLPLHTLATIGTDGVFTLLGVHEFLPAQPTVAWLEGQLCTLRPELCVSLLAAICGYRRGAVNATKLPLFLAYTPAGSSVQNLAHWAQAVRGSLGHPVMSWFDWGPTTNVQKYGNTEAPAYSLHAIPRSTRMVFFTGGQDRLADPLDIELLLETLPEGVVQEHIHDPELEHLDFTWGDDAPTRIYPRILALLQRDAVGDPARAGRTKT